MTWWQLTLAIYAAGSVVLYVFCEIASRHEDTWHGRITLGQLGCLLALFWPGMLVWLVIVGIGYAARWLYDEARHLLGRDRGS